MHQVFARLLLEQCSNTLVDAEATDEMRALANELVLKLLSLYDDGRLTRDVLLLALDSLSLIPDLERDVEQLRAAVSEGTSGPALLTEGRPTTRS